MVAVCKLVGVTQPSPGVGAENPGDLIAYIARVSNPANQLNNKTGPKLLRSLMRDGHWSPLEMVHVVMEITTTRDIARQIIRHRSFSFQEFSQRYAVQSAPPVFREARLQDTKNRQNSIPVDDENLHNSWRHAQEAVSRASENSYTWALENGIAKEQARAVLPEGMTESVLYMAGSLRSWVHYCLLRRGNGTQKEHMEVAQQCWTILMSLFPDITAAADEQEQSIADNVRAAEILDLITEIAPDAIDAAIKLEKERLLERQKMTLDKSP